MFVIIFAIFAIVVFVVLVLSGCLLVGCLLDSLLSGNISPSVQEVSSPSKDPSPPPKEISLSRDKVLPEEDANKINLIQIIPISYYLSLCEKKIFKVKATNKIGAEINTGLIQWQATGGKIDGRGKLIVDSQSKGTFKVTATSDINNLTCSANYTVLPKLTNIEIITTKETVIPGQEVYLELRGTDQTQSEINIEGQPSWSSTTGEISPKGKLLVDLPNQIVYITAKINELEAKATIQIGDRPHKVVNRIYPIDIPNPNPKTTPTQDNISIPIVSDHDPEDELSTKEPEQVKESSKLLALEIDAPDLIFLKPNQERVFTVHGIDQFGEYIDPGKILWRATGGEIDSQGRLIVGDDAKGSFRVTAISSNSKVSQHRLRQSLLLIKISLKIFSWVLSHKNFVKDTASYFVQEFCNSEAFIDEVFPDIDTSSIDRFLTILIFDDIKERIVEAVINTIINYFKKIIILCFKEEPSLLTYSVDYVVLPELRKLIINPSNINIKPGESINFYLIGIDQKGDKFEIEKKVSWKATGGRIDRKGKLTVNSNSQGIFRVTATVENRLDTFIYYNTFHSQESFEVTEIVDNISNISINCNILQDTSSVNIPSSGGIAIALYNKELREREIGKNHYRHTNK